MKDDKQHKIGISRVIQPPGNKGSLTLEDNRAESLTIYEESQGKNETLEVIQEFFCPLKLPLLLF